MFGSRLKVNILTVEWNTFPVREEWLSDCVFTLAAIMRSVIEHVFDRCLNLIPSFTLS